MLTTAKIDIMPFNVFWFRRDLRLSDNHGLYKALTSGLSVLPLFIFDTTILSTLPTDDKRVLFIHDEVRSLNHQLQLLGSGVKVVTGKPVEVFKELISSNKIMKVFTNTDYEPYALKRDNEIKELLEQSGVELLKFGDQLVFEPGEIVKPDGKPYEVYTPFSKKWIARYATQQPVTFPSEDYKHNFLEWEAGDIVTMQELGFKVPPVEFPGRELPVDRIKDYHLTRDYPAIEGTTRLGIHLRFGTVSIRECARVAMDLNEVWLKELIWREFFMHVLHFYPHVASGPFRSRYKRVQWVNNEDDFARWCSGTTGYPLVDAGMRQLKQSGFMHNRVRMVVGSFLTKHLLIDWRWGEAWFDKYLLDYDLSSNNGNWQWVAGCGCDAAPYFRVFNPVRQQQQYDSKMEYIRAWVPEFGTTNYPEPMIEHEFARQRCIKAYKIALE